MHSRMPGIQFENRKAKLFIGGHLLPGVRRNPVARIKPIKIGNRRNVAGVEGTDRHDFESCAGWWGDCAWSFCPVALLKEEAVQMIEELRVSRQIEELNSLLTRPSFDRYRQHHCHVFSRAESHGVNNALLSLWPDTSEDVGIGDGLCFSSEAAHEGNTGHFPCTTQAR